MSEIPEWLTVGAEVATLSSEWKRRGQRPRFAKVAKIGKREVVLNDEQRFNVSRLERRNGGAWDGVTRLLPRDAPVVVQAMDEWRYRQVVARAHTVAENWMRGQDGTTEADVIESLAPLTGLADEIAALFATTPSAPEPESGPSAASGAAVSVADGRQG